MSHFNRWWSKQHIKDKEAKRFSHTVWNEAAKPYQATIDKLTAELAEASTIANNNYEAHRKGWEQAKAEAKHLSFSCSCHKAIASMTYKEEER